MRRQILSLAYALLITGVMSASAFAGLTVNAVEFGFAKFHREDDRLHPYAEGHAWKPFILPLGASTEQPLVVQNGASSYSIYFSNTEDLIKQVAKLAQNTNEKIGILNIHAHGNPGALLVPPTQKMAKGIWCQAQRKWAAQEDAKIYETSYDKVSGFEFAYIDATAGLKDSFATRMLAPAFRNPCISSLHTFTQHTNAIPNFKQLFADDLKIHFLSCSVGLGKAGDQFTGGIANLFLTTVKGRVETTLELGLSDYSLPEGMGFWNKQSKQQVSDDMGVYVVNKTDREITQKGRIRIGQLDVNGNAVTQVLADQEFMFLK